MSEEAVLQRGRAAFDDGAWDEALVQLTAADRESPAAPADLERAATAAYLTGHDAESDAFWTRAYQQWLHADEPARAARCGFWLSFLALLRGDAAHSAGWLSRTQRLLDERQLDCVERGYLLCIEGMPAMQSGDNDLAHRTFSRTLEIADHFGDVDLMTFARLNLGETLLQMGRTSEGLRLLDEIMVAVTAGEVSPIPSGISYCAVILACQRIMDLQRATEWTAALGAWCDTQHGLVPFQGQCLVHRSEIMQLHGRWSDAIAEAQRACDRYSTSATLGMAFYQRGELHRLWGEFDQAEVAYREAAARGHETQPGLSRLRLAQGRLDAAVAAIRRVAAETTGSAGVADCLGRSRLLAAYVDIMLAAKDLDAARSGADELAGLARELQAPLLQAMSAQALGAVQLAQGEAVAALDQLNRACALWQSLSAPYEMARTRVLMGVACRAIGDHDTGQMHLYAARTVFEELGAAPDLTQLAKVTLKTAPGAAGILTARELEVLQLVAGGKTNRGVATDLFLSEKTVARHVSNILTKLGLSSRSAATAYAYEHDLMG
jgi:DNA-binding CsgD family transcriptional regulator